MEDMRSALIALLERNTKMFEMKNALDGMNGK